FFFSSRRRHTRFSRDWSSDVCSSDLELINGHVWDAHEFHIADWNGHPITLGLPVILWTDNGLTTFSSTRFQHDNSGEVVVEENRSEERRVGKECRSGWVPYG